MHGQLLAVQFVAGLQVVEGVGHFLDRLLFLRRLSEDVRGILSVLIRLIIAVHRVAFALLSAVSILLELLAF